MVNQLLHAGLHVFAARGCHFVVVCDDRAGIAAQPFHTLRNDAIGLTQLLNANQIPVVTVTGFANRDIKIHLVINIVGLVFTQIPSNARTAQHRSGEAQVFGSLRSDHANAHGALLPNTVVGQQRFVLVNVFGETFCKVFDEIQQRALAVFIQLRNRSGIFDFVGLVLRHGVG